MEEHHETLQRMLKAQSKVNTINEARKGEDIPPDVEAAVEEEGIKLVGEAEMAMYDVYDMGCDNISLSECISMLNEDQKRVFNQVADHLNCQCQHECDEYECSNLEPLHMFISSVG